VGVLESPGGIASGIGLISGWVCSATTVEVRIDDAAPIAAAYGTPRGDTVGACGDANNGFGMLINWNNLGDGQHSIVALADGIPFATTTFRVATLGQAFLRGASGGYTVNFAGRNVLLRWDEGLQNFVIEGTQ
jgi:hypothetical protein